MPTVTAKNAKLVLYADDTSLIITSASHDDFVTKLRNVISDIQEWFKNNLLFLNLKKTTYLQFLTKNSQKLDLRGGTKKKNKTSLNAAKRGGVGEGRQCLFPRPSTISSETDVFL